MPTHLLNPRASDLVAVDDLTVCQEHLTANLGNLVTQPRHLRRDIRDAREYIAQQTVEQRDILGY